MATITTDLRELDRVTLHALSDDLLTAQARGIDVDPSLMATVNGEIERRLVISLRRRRFAF